MEIDDLNLSPADMLKEVNKAIVAITIGGQEYRLGNRYLKRADLSALRILKNDLAAEASAGNGNGLMDNTYAAYFDRR
jgi:hypothetical protein